MIIKCAYVTLNSIADYQFKFHRERPIKKKSFKLINRSSKFMLLEGSERRDENKFSGLLELQNSGKTRNHDE